MKSIDERLDYLKDCAKEEGGAINEESVQSFLSFMKWMSGTAGTPAISLTPDNEVYATWEGNRVDSFRFYANGMIKHITI